MNEKACVKCGGTDNLFAIYRRGPRSEGRLFVTIGAMCTTCVEGPEVRQ